jgi:hypothetical protein
MDWNFCNIHLLLCQSIVFYEDWFQTINCVAKLVAKFFLLLCDIQFVLKMPIVGLDEKRCCLCNKQLLHFAARYHYFFYKNSVSFRGSDSHQRLCPWTPLVVQPHILITPYRLAFNALAMRVFRNANLIFLLALLLVKTIKPIPIS